MNNQSTLIQQQLDYLKLPFLKAQHAELAQQAAQQSWTHVDYLARLIDGQYQQRLQHTIQLRVRAARFPVLKTLEQFRWDWPKKINRLQVRRPEKERPQEPTPEIPPAPAAGVGRTGLPAY